MNERIKQLRKALGLTQADFGERLGLSQSAIAGYEKAFREPSDAIILSICNVFHVREPWLRTGEGAMFASATRDEELAAFFEQLQHSSPDFRHRLISVLARLSAEEWALLERKARELLAELQKVDP